MSEHHDEQVTLTEAERESLLVNELALDNLHADWGQAALFGAVEAVVAGRLAKVEAWLRETTEAEWRETCQFDHHGDCQMHGYDAPCPIPAIRDYFEEATDA